MRQCAPRILARISAWQTPARQRIKTPMPPVTALQAQVHSVQDWPGSEALAQMLRYASGLTREQGRPTAMAELLSAGYEALPSCLPANTSQAAVKATH